MLSAADVWQYITRKRKNNTGEKINVFARCFFVGAGIMGLSIV